MEILPHLAILYINRIFRGLVFLIFIGILSAPNTQAQSSKDSLRQKHNGISVLPQYVMIRGVRLDYERRIAKGDLWVLFAPQFFIDNKGYYDYYYSYSESVWTSYNYLRGVGANAYLKWNLHKSEKLDRISGLPARLFYIAGGPAYQYYKLEGYNELPVAYEENGTTFYKFEYQKVISKIHRYGGNINVGMQFAMDPFYVDIFTGFAYKISLDENGDKIAEEYAGFMDPFYSGLYIDGGFKFGVYF